MRISDIAERVLPSFRGFHTAVEVRLGYKGGKVEAAVPIVVAHLHTDKDGSEVHFQMTRADIESLRRRFEDLTAKLDSAEEWMTGSTR